MRRKNYSENNVERKDLPIQRNKKSEKKILFALPILYYTSSTSSCYLICFAKLLLFFEMAKTKHCIPDPCYVHCAFNLEIIEALQLLNQTTNGFMYTLDKRNRHNEKENVSTAFVSHSILFDDNLPELFFLISAK